MPLIHHKSLQVFLLLAACGEAASLRSSNNQLELNLNDAYKGKVVVLRDFYRGARLRYSANGDLVKGGPPGPWTLYGDVEIQQVKFRHDTVEIKGKRIFLAFDPDRKEFRGYRATDVRIEIELSADAASLSVWQRLFGRMFVSESEHLGDLMPGYWKRFLSGMQGQQNQPAPNDSHTGKKIEKVGGDVKAPVPIHKPEPPYTEEARSAKYQGTVVFWLVVNTQGGVEDITLVKPLGMGLDDKAVETVLGWKFKPATRKGVPVPVRVLVEISFRLF